MRYLWNGLINPRSLQSFQDWLVISASLCSLTTLPISAKKKKQDTGQGQGWSITGSIGNWKYPHPALAVWSYARDKNDVGWAIVGSRVTWLWYSPENQPTQRWWVNVFESLFQNSLWICEWEGFPIMIHNPETIYKIYIYIYVCSSK